MPTIDTKQFGLLEYNEENVFVFPTGLPGFECETRFLCIERPALRPVVFLQSADRGDLCFITIPARAVDPAYELELLPDELKILETADHQAVADQASLACLAILCLPEGGEATANLLGPVVLSRETRKGVQAVRDDRRYSALTPLRPGPGGSTQEQSAPGFVEA